jgi:hypothetical protein
MICARCNAIVPDDSAFCHNCGARVESAVQPEGREEPHPRPQPTSRPPGATAARTQPPPMAPAAAARPPRTGSRYAGASIVATTLSIIGWVVAVGGVIVGIILASEYEPGYGEENAGAIRFGLFIGTAIAAWIYACLILWAAYALRLLSDIEVEVRSGRGSGR